MAEDQPIKISAKLEKVDFHSDKIRVVLGGLTLENAMQIAWFVGDPVVVTFEQVQGKLFPKGGER